MAEKLTGNARKTALAKLNGWSEVKDRDAISRTFTSRRSSTTIRNGSTSMTKSR